MNEKLIDQIISEIMTNKPNVFPKIIEVALQTQTGGYGSEDVFCGTRIPILRKIAAKYKDLSLELTEILLQNELHEARFLALVILTTQFKKYPKEIFELYIRNTKYINNWDLVDISSHVIVGNYCFLFHNNDPILDLANSDNLWENRAAIVSTWRFIKYNYFNLTFELCEQFINHPHHLIHKASGWMLREISKKDPLQVIEFVSDHKNIPTIMRSYALEFIRKQNIKN